MQVELKEFDESTKSSTLAAKALGCTLGEIAKSLVFVGRWTVVVIISGDRRVDGGKLARVVGSEFQIATPAEVREKTGFPIGGVPPFPHVEGVLVMVDRSLTRFSHVWAAAGTPYAVFRIGTSDLLRLVGSSSVDVAE